MFAWSINRLFEKRRHGSGVIPAQACLYDYNCLIGFLSNGANSTGKLGG